MGDLTDEKKELIFNRIVEALEDYEYENDRNFPKEGRIWETKGHGYTVYLEGERKMLDCMAIYEDDEGVYEMVWTLEEGLVGQPVQTHWK